jgi:glycosyltransferase involved in cell wall biosynthesis
MAAETAFISVDVGFASMMAGGIIVKDEREMADAIRKLLEDGALRRTLAKQGREACETTYDWKMIMPKYDELLESLAAQGSTHA